MDEAEEVYLRLTPVYDQMMAHLRDDRLLVDILQRLCDASVEDAEKEFGQARVRHVIRYIADHCVNTLDVRNKFDGFPPDEEAAD